MIGKPFALATVGVLAALVACTGTLPAGATCSGSSECETGLACLYILGSGCSASAQCVVPLNDCGGSAAGLAPCGCNGAPLPTCIPSNLALSQRTASGAACLTDAGGDEEADTD
jgi:hypothetical protein